MTMLDYKSTALHDFVDKCEKLGDILKEMIEWSYENQKAVHKYRNLIEKVQEAMMILFSTMTNFSVKKFSHFYSEVDHSIEVIETCNNHKLTG